MEDLIRNLTLKSKTVEPAKEASGAVLWWMCVVGGGEEDKEGGAHEGLKRHQRWMTSGSMAVLGLRVYVNHTSENQQLEPTYPLINLSHVNHSL
ncbi:hypothetical protein QVD17_39141 [Tagetes erecta]|uniref:Uncharacterized protein n=1 Tax=Tagetes erecta TaxID=13708 RepID=A0AAD8JN08_TARER|nr:hypothetical protein QVD17_39141 [Tagetes erecta]